MEKRETITLDARAQQRLYVLNHVLAGALTAEEAGRVLHLSVRQVRRLLVRYRSAEGASALIHGNHGRTPVNRIDRAIRSGAGIDPCWTPLGDLRQRSHPRAGPSFLADGRRAADGGRAGAREVAQVPRCSSRGL